MPPILGSATGIVVMSPPQEDIDWVDFLTLGASTTTPFFETSNLEFVPIIASEAAPATKGSYDSMTTRFDQRSAQLFGLRRQRSSISPSLSASALLDFSERERIKYQALNQRRAYHLRFVESGRLELVFEGRWILDQFINASSDALALLEYGQSPRTTEPRFDECMKVAPWVLQLNSPRMIVELVYELVRWTVLSIKTGPYTDDLLSQKLLSGLYVGYNYLTFTGEVVVRGSRILARLSTACAGSAAVCVRRFD
jgi:hypothetical protein